MMQSYLRLFHHQTRFAPLYITPTTKLTSLETEFMLLVVGLSVVVPSAGWQFDSIKKGSKGAPSPLLRTHVNV